jgi:pantetheine-phosphate adenylyltransferase
MTNERTALFPGTFDPFTNGHLDLTRRAARLFERVVVAVAHNPGKGALFTHQERVALIRGATRTLKRVEVVDFSGLVVQCAREVGALVMIRGLRAVSDFEFEFQMALMNRRLSRGLEVAYLMPSQQYTYLNSTLVKEVARLGGVVRGLVPRTVEDALRVKLGVTNRGATVSPESARRGVIAAPAKRSSPGAARGAGGASRARSPGAKAGRGRRAEVRR